MEMLRFKKFDGLHIVCKKCNKTIEVNHDIYNGCNHPIEKQRYKALFRISGERKTRDLKSTDYNEAIKELLAFKDGLANPLRFKTPELKKEAKSGLFVDTINIYSDWMEGIDVPQSEARKRTPKYIKETVGYVVRFKDFLKSNGYNMSKLSIYDIDKSTTEKYFAYIVKNVKNPSTFNSHIRALKNFYNCLINDLEYVMPNPVKKWKLRHEEPNPVSVDDNDFIKLLNNITKEDSTQVYKSGAKKNMYRPFIKDGVELAAYTGMRLEEVATLKFKDVVEDINGKLLYLNGTDLKFERGHNWGETKPKKTVPIPMTLELEGLLNRLGYKENKATDKYIIDGETTMNRASLGKQLSHSFTFYRRKAGLPDNISIKHLRKTFLTKLETQTGLTSAAGYQKSSSVIRKNYIDKLRIVEEIAKRGFGYFKDNSQPAQL
jgi:integrase